MRVGDAFDVSANQSSESYRDIDGKRSTIFLGKNILRTDKKIRSFGVSVYAKIFSEWTL